MGLCRFRNCPISLDSYNNSYTGRCKHCAYVCSSHPFRFHFKALQKIYASVHNSPSLACCIDTCSAIWHTLSSLHGSRDIRRNSPSYTSWPCTTTFHACNNRPDSLLVEDKAFVRKYCTNQGESYRD